MIRFGVVAGRRDRLGTQRNFTLPSDTVCPVIEPVDISAVVAKAEVRADWWTVLARSQTVKTLVVCLR